MEGSGVCGVCVRSYPLVRDVDYAMLVLDGERVGNVKFARRRELQANPRSSCVKDLLAGDGNNFPIAGQHDPAIIIVRDRVLQNHPSMLLGQGLIH